LKTPFKISFKEKVNNIPNKTILENFKENLDGTYCDYLEINNDKELIVKNDFFRWKPDWNFNLWVGIGNAKITIEENEMQSYSPIKYSIDFSRLTITYILTIILFSVVLPIYGYFELLFIMILVLIAIIMHGITFFRHWSFFKQTIKHGINYLGNYDWESIIKNKTEIELVEIKNGNRQLPKSVIRLAELELEKRKGEMTN